MSNVEMNDGRLSTGSQSGVGPLHCPPLRRGGQDLLHYSLSCRCNSYPGNTLDGWNVAQSDGLKMSDEICPTQLKNYAVYCIPIPEIFEAPAV